MTAPSDTTEPEPVLEAVRMAWRKALPQPHIEDHQSWTDVGGDSLSALKMLAHLEIILGRPVDHAIVDMEMTPVTLACRIIRAEAGLEDGGNLTPNPVSDE